MEVLDGGVWVLVLEEGEEGVGLFGVCEGVVGVFWWGEGLGDGVVLVGDDDGLVCFGHSWCLPGFVVLLGVCGRGTLVVNFGFFCGGGGGFGGFL